MFDMLVEEIARKQSEWFAKNENDYFCEVNKYYKYDNSDYTTKIWCELNEPIKLLYCGNCRTQKQVIINILGNISVQNCICECQQAKIQDGEIARRRTIAESRKREALEILKRISLPTETISKFTFDKDVSFDRKNYEFAKEYVNNFSELKKNGKGMILHGNVGRGKTFYASCIYNELKSKYCCLFTNTAKIGQTIQTEQKFDYMKALTSIDLLILDDLGAERQTDYMNEMIYNIVNERYMKMLPTIITTNLTADELADERNPKTARIYSRLIERSHRMMLFGEKNVRVQNYVEYHNDEEWEFL